MVEALARVVGNPPITLHQGLRSLAPLASEADLAITSCGRTTYELAACQVPMLCIPQNDHERRHIAIAQQLGARIMLPDALPHLAEAIESCFDPEWRRSAKDRMASLDLQGGAQRFWDIVWRTYEERTKPPVPTPVWAVPCAA
jgi:spore coat polysaccharide biosynthesis predicted glycosyltransferase SpsG